MRSGSKDQEGRSIDLPSYPPAWEHCTVMLAEELKPGDSVIGANDQEYLIESIERQRFHLLLFCINEQGAAVKTSLEANNQVQAIPNREAKMSNTEAIFGLKLCDNCGKTRSRARYWEEDDYICKICREGVDSGHA